MKVFQSIDLAEIEPTELRAWAEAGIIPVDLYMAEIRRRAPPRRRAA